MTQTRSTADGTPTAGPVEPTPLRFLVVDDNEDIRDLFVRMVERLGHTADRACDGVEAVETLRYRSYDFMLLDLTMPRMGGEDVLRWLREHPGVAPNLRVVVASAWASTHQSSLEALGACGVLPKPVSIHQLRDLLAALGVRVTVTGGPGPGTP